ncbi:hypothetical protein Lal_00000935 [Lupinus albus]|nr:hypothetical protein Lal_00000935 [Lupinus albus]
MVAVIVLSNRLKNFKNLMRHKTKEFSLESLISRLCIKEESRRQDQRDKILLVSNNKTKKKFSAALLRPVGNNFKNEKCNENMNKNTNNYKN